MSRRTMVSALCVAGLCAVTALAQPPKGDPVRNDPSQPNKGKALDAFAKAMREGVALEASDKAKPADPADAAVAAALANDPDVMVARARFSSRRPNLARRNRGLSSRS